MHPALALEIAVGHVAFYLDGHRLDAGFVTVLKVADARAVVVLLTVAQIHAHKHRGPVLALRATGTAVYLQDAVHDVLVLTEHIFEFKRLEHGRSLLIIGIHLFFCHHLVLVEIEGKSGFLNQGLQF